MLSYPEKTQASNASVEAIDSMLGESLPVRLGVTGSPLLFKNIDLSLLTLDQGRPAALLEALTDMALIRECV